MLLLGHIGITAGVAKACDILASMPSSNGRHGLDSDLKPRTVPAKKRVRLHWLYRFKMQLEVIDYRIVVTGSLLPDVIDKSVWLLANSDITLSGRHYGHTLVFSLALLIGGLFLIRYGKPWLLVLSLSNLAHLVLDQMWYRPTVLLWPLLGPLPREESTGWLANIILELFSQPDVYIPEIIGLMIISAFIYRLVIKKRVLGFFRNGVVV